MCTGKQMEMPCWFAEQQSFPCAAPPRSHEAKIKQILPENSMINHKTLNRFFLLLHKHPFYKKQHCYHSKKPSCQ